MGRGIYRDGEVEALLDLIAASEDPAWPIVKQLLVDGERTAEVSLTPNGPVSVAVLPGPDRRVALLVGDWAFGVELLDQDQLDRLTQERRPVDPRGAVLGPESWRTGGESDGTWELFNVRIHRGQRLP